MTRRWIARTSGPAEERPLARLGEPAADAPFEALAERLGIPAAVVELLVRRGLRDPAEMNVFLSPLLRHLAPPQCFPGMEEGAKALVQAIGEGREVLVWGDYDVDGVTASALCHEVLHYHRVPVRVHLPDRQEEGYGLNIPALEAICADNVPRVLLTVDCGINDSAPVARARELGLKVVVTDHHLPPEVLPEADALCNPRLAPDCPCPYLAGVGVAFFLMAKVNALLPELSGIAPMDMRQVLDLVGLGTLADMVSLTGQNRILAKNGLLKIAEAARPGLAELKAVSGYDRAAKLGAGQVVFSLAPRLNAAGRVGSAGDAFALLAGYAAEAVPGSEHDAHGRAAGEHAAAGSTLSEHAASENAASGSGQSGCEHIRDIASLARRLNDLNSARRAEEEHIAQEAMQQAEELLAAQPDLAGLVVFGADWHPGVIGIVASRLVERFYRPALVLCRLADGVTLKGSGRSVPDFDLYGGLCRCADLLSGFGGHRQAAGLSVPENRLPALRRRFHEAVQSVRGKGPFTPILELDGILPFSLASDFTFLKAMELLQPFGVGNPEPVFASNPLVLRSVRLFGYKREHASLRVLEPESGITLQARLWRQADTLPPLAEGQPLRLAFTVGINAYNGIASVELTVKDWQLMDAAPAQS